MAPILDDCWPDSSFGLQNLKNNNYNTIIIKQFGTFENIRTILTSFKPKNTFVEDS